MTLAGGCLILVVVLACAAALAVAVGMLDGAAEQREARGRRGARGEPDRYFGPGDLGPRRDHERDR